MTRKTRSDKKYMVKVWCQSVHKRSFKSICKSQHLSMLNIGSYLLTYSLDNFGDKGLQQLIENRSNRFIKNKKFGEEYELIGLRVTDQYWQQLAHYCVMYDTSVSRIASCIFDYCITSEEMRKVWSKLKE